MGARAILRATSILIAAAPIGCVERTLTITSDPAGALVYVSSVEVGRTPVNIPFTFYGTYDVTLRLEGYETLDAGWRVDPPVYDLFPVDLLSEMAPWTYHVDRKTHFTLQESQPPSDADLIRRAGELRQDALKAP
ncbi:MAG TPA: PEGA domain-containing protein [Phycisphaerae bacterium]|nr:PEGA domain-containing protein [Phycisphaerae bacterium]HUU21907.1 PEGA domain-containing protein [Phycisphaerae bacterium]